MATGMGGGLLLALYLLLSLPPLARAQTPLPHGAAPCEPIERYYTRTMQVWYGSLWQDSTVLTDVLELTDHVAEDLSTQIASVFPYSDTRVTSAIHAWIVTDVNDMEWVLGEPENLPVEQNLRARLSDVSASIIYRPSFSTATGHILSRIGVPLRARRNAREDISNTMILASRLWSTGN